MTVPGDSWSAGEAYEAYMGRWSGAVARAFLRWLDPAPGRRWLDVGCGTGALTRAILDACDPDSVVGCDPSAPFVEHARRLLEGSRVDLVVGGIETLPPEIRGFEVAVSGLMLNFVPDPVSLVREIRERVRPGGTIAAYVWDYPRVEFLQTFWEEAVALDPGATAHHESRRFGDWSGEAFASRLRDAGLDGVTGGLVEISTRFSSFDDFWNPFLGGTGPAPGYVAALAPAGREELAERLRNALPRETDGGLPLRARALVARGTVPGYPLAR